MATLEPDPDHAGVGKFFVEASSVALQDAVRVTRSSFDGIFGTARLFAAGVSNECRSALHRLDTTTRITQGL
jgi:hypothetical protein